MTFPHFDWVTLLLDGCAIPIVEVLILNTRVLHIWVYRRSPHPPPAHTLTEQRPLGFNGIHEKRYFSVQLSFLSQIRNLIMSLIAEFILYSQYGWMKLDMSCKNGVYSFESFSNTEINPSCLKGKKLEYDLYIYITKVFCSYICPIHITFSEINASTIWKEIRKSYLILLCAVLFEINNCESVLVNLWTTNSST